MSFKRLKSYVFTPLKRLWRLIWPEWVSFDSLYRPEEGFPTPLPLASEDWDEYGEDAVQELSNTINAERDDYSVRPAATVRMSDTAAGLNAMDLQKRAKANR